MIRKQTGFTFYMQEIALWEG